MIYDCNNKTELSKLQKLYEDLLDQYREAWRQHLEEKYEH